MKRSRLTKYVLYHHAGYVNDLGFTCSFKPVIIEFKRVKDAENVINRWYIIRKKPVKEKLIITSKDLEPLTTIDLLDLGRRMRMRFFKLLKSVGEKGGRVDKNMWILPVRKLPHRLLEYELGFLMLRTGGVIEYDKYPFATILVKLRKETEYVLLSEMKTGKRALIASFNCFKHL